MEPVAEEDLYLYCYAAGTQFREVYGLKMIHYAYCSLMIKYNYCGNGFMVPVLEKQKWNHASIIHIVNMHHKMHCCSFIL